MKVITDTQCKKVAGGWGFDPFSFGVTVGALIALGKVGEKEGWW